MSLINECESFSSCRGDASDAGELSAPLLPPALPGERRGPSPPALNPRDVPWVPTSRAAAHSPLRPPKLRGCRRLSPVSRRFRGFTRPGGFCQGSSSIRVSSLAGQATAPVPQPHGYGCPLQHPLLRVLLAAPGVSSPQFPGPAGGYGWLSASSEPRGRRGAQGRAVLGRHQPQHARGLGWYGAACRGPGPYSPTRVGSILTARIPSTVPTSTGTAGSALSQQDGTTTSHVAFQPRGAARGVAASLLARTRPGAGPHPARAEPRAVSTDLGVCQSLWKGLRVTDTLLRTAGGVRGAPVCQALQQGGTGRAPQGMNIFAREQSGDRAGPCPPPCLLLPVRGICSEIHRPEFAAGGGWEVPAWFPARCLEFCSRRVLAVSRTRTSRIEMFQLL